MDTLVTTILVDVTIYASRRTHCQLSSRTPYGASSRRSSPFRGTYRPVTLAPYGVLWEGSIGTIRQVGTCTRNRHRWVGREYLGARDNSL